MPAHLQSLWIEHNYFISPAVADESPADVSHQRDSMDSLQTRNAPHHCSAVSVYHFDFRIVRDVKPPSGIIEGDVIPILLAARRRAKIIFLQQAVSSLLL